jgi:septin family protein
MPTELNSLTQSYIKIQKCMNASFNSHDYKFFKSLLNENELDCLKHLQHLKHYHTYRSNSLRKKNQEILDNIVNDEINNNSDLIDKPIKRQKKIIDSDTIIPEI